MCSFPRLVYIFFSDLILLFVLIIFIYLRNLTVYEWAFCFCLPLRWPAAGIRFCSRKYCMSGCKRLGIAALLRRSKWRCLCSTKCASFFDYSTALWPSFGFDFGVVLCCVLFFFFFVLRVSTESDCALHFSVVPLFPHSLVAFGSVLFPFEIISWNCFIFYISQKLKRKKVTHTYNSIMYWVYK